MSQEENNAIPAHINDELMQLDYEYWETAPSDYEKQITILFKMIERLTTLLFCVNKKIK